MDDSKSSTSNIHDHFFDAFDEFPFYDCVDTSEPESVSQSSSISQLDPIEDNAVVSQASKSLPGIPSPEAVRRRRMFSHRIRKDISASDQKDSNPNSSVSFAISDTSTAAAVKTTVPRERKYRFPRNFTENERESEKLDSAKARFSSGSIGNREKEVIKENSTVTFANGERVDESSTFDSHSGVVNESSSNFLFFLAGLVIKAIGFQINVLVSFFTFPIWLLHCSYVFVIDPFRAVRLSIEHLTRRLLRIWAIMCGSFTTFIYGWLKEQKSLWLLALRFGWGLLWSIYVCFILVSLLVSSFLVGGSMMSFLVDKPIQMKETLSFDYTKNTPVASVPIISCPDVPGGVNYREKIEVGKIGELRVIPPNHKLHVTVSLTLPESDYNRNLGNFQVYLGLEQFCVIPHNRSIRLATPEVVSRRSDFLFVLYQVRVDFLSVHGKALASLRRPCLLQFKSDPIRLLLTFLKIAPLVAGYSSESQTLNINFRGFTEEDTPTACLRVIVEQRAEFRPGAGVPEIYDASLTLESKLPLLKRILWNWKNTIFIWISMMMFTMQLLFTLLCCKPFIIPRVRLRGSSASSSATQNNPPTQR